MAEIIGKSIIKLTSVDSTNNYATNNMLAEKWYEGTVVVSEEQTKGRGQINNSWESEFGKNLLLSIVLYPKFLPIHNQFLLSKVCALGVCDAIGEYVGNVKIKWPNDIYVGRKKIAGILIENIIMGSSISSSVLGIGLNINQNEFFSDAPNPVSLCQLLGEEISRKLFLDRLLDNIDFWYKRLADNEISVIDDAFLSSLFLLNEVSTFTDNTGTYNGRILGVDEIGRLKIQPKNDDVIRTYHFKEVEYVL